MKKSFLILLSAFLFILLISCVTGDGDDPMGDGIKTDSREETTPSETLSENTADTTEGEVTTEPIPDEGASEELTESVSETETQTEVMTESDTVYTGFPNEAESDGTKRY